MAYSFPLSLAQFMDILPIREMTFDLPETMELSETGGGEVLAADLGTRLWQGEIQLGDMTADEAAEALAMLDVLRRAAGSFMVHDKRRPAPRSDLNGAALSGFAVKLASVSGNTREVTLSGLPAGFQLLRHDYLAFSYGTNPTRYALHRIASPATANGSGVTGLFEVSPNIRPGWVANAAVSLVKPACKARILPGSVNPGRHRHTMTAGVSFRFQQTLR